MRRALAIAAARGHLLTMPTTHEFSIDDVVEWRGGWSHLPPPLCKVLGLFPAGQNGVLQYRVRSANEIADRMVPEDEMYSCLARS